MFYSIVSKISTFPERIFLVYLLAMEEETIDVIPLDLDLIVYKYILGFFILYRLGESLIISIVNLIKYLLATPRKD